MYHFPEKIELGIFPTPIQKLNTISRKTNCNIFIKRDDLCGVAFGGNKLRKLEYLFADAQAKGCDCIITAGGSTSNQTVATAACGGLTGMEIHIVIPQTTGNATRNLLDYAGATVHIAESSDALKKEMKSVEKLLKSENKKPFIIPIGASTTLGVLGYANAVKEIAEQIQKLNLQMDHIVCAGGSGNTYTGLLLGTKLYMPHTKATVVSIARRFAHKETLRKNALEAAALIGASVQIDESDVNIHFCSGKGIKDVSPKGKQAIRLLAREEGIFLDPIYTGKGFAGLMELIDTGYFQPDENILFIHTGGTVSLINTL